MAEAQKHSLQSKTTDQTRSLWQLHFLFKPFFYFLWDFSHFNKSQVAKTFYKCIIFITSLLSFVAIVLVLNFPLISPGLSAAGGLEYFYLICIFCLVEVCCSTFRTVSVVVSISQVYVFSLCACFFIMFLIPWSQSDKMCL